MKKIITTSLLFGIAIFSNGLFAQELSGDKMKIFQTDKLEDIKKVFKKDDFTKCFKIKETSYDLLALSVRYERTNVFNYILSNKPDVNKSCSDVTPLMYAAMYGHMDITKILLKHGAKKDTKDKNGMTAKDYAVKNKHDAIAMIL